MNLLRVVKYPHQLTQYLDFQIYFIDLDAEYHITLFNDILTMISNMLFLTFDLLQILRNSIFVVLESET